MMRAVASQVGLLAMIAKAYGQDLSQYVLPLVGSADGGNTFPGVSLPNGMVKVGPDMSNKDHEDSYSGYQADGDFIAFSMLHEHGTGGAPKYGVVSQMPMPGPIDSPLEELNIPRSAPDEAELGYYHSYLATGIEVELGATEKAAQYQYSFPDNSTDPTVLVNVSHVLPSFRGMGLSQHYVGGNITIQEDSSGQVTGYTGSGSYNNGYNRAPAWTVYFCGYFDKPATYKTFLAAESTGTELQQYNETAHLDSELRLGAVFSFGSAKSVVSRVGVSFISTDQACQSVDTEIPADTSLETLVDDAKKAWNDAVLSKVTTKDTSNTTNLELLYTSLYHMSLLPTNKTGENPLWQSDEPYWDDIFTFWDIFRCTTALFHIIQPQAYEEFIRSLVDIWRNEGFMPDARSSFYNGVTQGGSNADNVLADAYVKGVRGQINWEDAYQAMVTDAEVVPENNDDPRDPSSSTKEGRGALPDWKEYGYITTKYGRSVTRAIEYSANDFGLYQVASGLSKIDDARKYFSRSRNWRNQWNPDMSALNFTGFLGPIDEDGNFVEQDPLSCSGCYWGDPYYEGLPMEYSFNAHHDLAKTIELSGGNDAFLQRLEAMFEPNLNPSGDDAFDNTIFNPGNEPSFTTPYLFNFVGRQDLSVKHSRFNAKSYYQPTESGLPGNSDAGAMESWVLWSMIGLYPITGQTTFLVGSPWFSDLTIDLGGEGKTLSITTTGGSEDSYYVQSLKVNGEDWDKSWVTWDDVFAQGGTMEFELGPDPADWATGDLPPTPASDDFPLSLSDAQSNGASR